MNEGELTAAERALVETVRGLRFGAVEATVHDGHLVRIERREKVRFAADPTTEAAGTPREETARQRPDRRSPPTSDEGGRT